MMICDCQLCRHYERLIADSKRREEQLKEEIWATQYSELKQTFSQQRQEYMEVLEEIQRRVCR